MFTLWLITLHRGWHNVLYWLNSVFSRTSSALIGFHFQHFHDDLRFEGEKGQKCQLIETLNIETTGHDRRNITSTSTTILSSDSWSTWVWVTPRPVAFTLVTILSSYVFVRLKCLMKKTKKDAEQELSDLWNNLSIVCLWTKMHQPPKVMPLCHSATADLASARLRPSTHKIRSQKAHCSCVHVKESSALWRTGLRLTQRHECWKAALSSYK